MPELTGKVGVGLARQGGIVLFGHLGVDGLPLVVKTRHGDLVLGPQLGHLGHPVQIGVVSEMTLEDDPLPDAQVTGVDGDPAVLGGATGSDVGPVSFLFLHVETGGIGEEDPGPDGAGEAEPVDDPERGSGVYKRERRGQQEGSCVSRETLGDSPI